MEVLEGLKGRCEDTKSSFLLFLLSKQSVYRTLGMRISASPPAAEGLFILPVIECQVCDKEVIFTWSLEMYG